MNLTKIKDFLLNLKPTEEYFFSIKMNIYFTNKITMMIKQKNKKNKTKYNNINNTRNYTNTEP